MMTVTFEEYQKLYTDVTAKEDYTRLYNRAEYLLRGWTARRVDDVRFESDYRYKQVKSAIIYVIHSIAVSGYANSVVSVSNDGYSETYASAKDQDDALKNAVFDILSGTGLMGCL